MSEFVPDAELEMVLEADIGNGSVANNLTTTEEGYVLDARQGPAIVTLLNGKVSTNKIANNLTTTGSGYVLDARQGKALKTDIDELDTEVDGKLPLAGGEMTGDLTLKDCNLILRVTDSPYYGTVSIRNERLAFRLMGSGGMVNEIHIAKDGLYTKYPFDINDGGTGATTAETARKNLGAASVKYVNKRLEAENWSSTLPYTQTITVDDALESDHPTVDAYSLDTDSAASALKRYKAWACVNKIKAGDGTLTAYCYEKKPEVDIPILVQILR